MMHRTYKRHRGSRRGASVLWLIVFMPLALTGLIFTIEIGRLWLARAEVENALESGALAAVIEWERLDPNTVLSTETARQAAADLAATNTVLGAPFAFADPNLNFSPCNLGNGQVFCNGNDQLDGELVFGAITQIQPTVVFDPEANPLLPNHFHAVLVRSAFSVPSQISLGGYSLGPYSVQAESVAMVDSNGQARLVRIDSIASP
ncbi:MAG: TadE/TadG family type IV pilus assembly protein [Blastopirellula sp. JB062]